MYVDGMGIISKDGVTDIPTILTRNVGTVDGYLWVADLQAQLGDKLKITVERRDVGRPDSAGSMSASIRFRRCIQRQSERWRWSLTADPLRADRRFGQACRSAFRSRRAIRLWVRPSMPISLRCG